MSSDPTKDGDPVLRAIRSVCVSDVGMAAHFGSGDDARVFTESVVEDDDKVALPLLLITPLEGDLETDSERYVDMDQYEVAVYAHTFGDAMAALRAATFAIDRADLSAAGLKMVHNTHGGTVRERVKQNEVMASRIFTLGFSRQRSDKTNAL